MKYTELEKRIFNINSEEEFLDLAIDIFRFQYQNNEIYKQYVDYLGVNVEKVQTITEIPFLPIEFFKNKKIVTNIPDFGKREEILFKSSGTTGTIRSCHYLKDVNLYEESFLTGFEYFFGKPEDYVILALLPSYLEAGESSLVYMVNRLIELSGHKESRFALNKFDEILASITQLKKENRKVILFGVSYALLDLAEKLHLSYENLMIIETGGMKGRREEITREELHKKISNGFGTKKVYSEYGMTELLSQAYALNNGFFEPAQTMKILIRDINDPFSYLDDGKTGGINIIDLSNIYSCSFIETKDLGKLKNTNFEVLGRFDNSDIRGCNLLVM